MFFLHAVTSLRTIEWKKIHNFFLIKQITANNWNIKAFIWIVMFGYCFVIFFRRNEIFKEVYMWILNLHCISNRGAFTVPTNLSFEKPNRVIRRSLRIIRVDNKVFHKFKLYIVLLRIPSQSAKTQYTIERGKKWRKWKKKKTMNAEGFTIW